MRCRSEQRTLTVYYCSLEGETLDGEVLSEEQPAATAAGVLVALNLIITYRLSQSNLI